MDNQRKYDRVDTHVKVKLTGDPDWTECSEANVSGGGLYFTTASLLNAGDTVMLQFMLQSKMGSIANVHFFASARIVRVKGLQNGFGTAVEFIIDEDVRKELLKLIEIIKTQNLKVERPTTLDAVLGRLDHDEQKS